MDCEKCERLKQQIAQSRFESAALRKALGDERAERAKAEWRADSMAEVADVAERAAASIKQALWELDNDPAKEGACPNA